MNRKQLFQPNGLVQKENHRKEYKIPRDSGQDKSAPLRERIATRQPSRVLNIARSHETNTKKQRAKNRSTNRQTEPFTTWLPKPIAAGVRQLMAQNGWV